jgi:hypothetical protein
MTTKAQLLSVLANTERQLAASERSYIAAFEWFCAETRGEMPLCIDVAGDSGIRVLVHGLTRACGGVAVVSLPAESFRDMPEHLDDLLPRWFADNDANIRHAARSIESARTAATAYQQTAHLNDF